MQKLPFDLVGRQSVEGGVLLFFGCRTCGGEATLFLRSSDPLAGKYPVACRCGEQINFYFGSPLVGKALLRSVAEREPSPSALGPDPSIN